MRIDRLATLYVFHPLASRTVNGGGVPILMYHSVSGESEQGHPYFHTATSPVVFAAQMEYLKEQGYTAVRLSEVADILEGRTKGIRRPVAITFDDGFRDFYTQAFPVLARCGYTATMFLPTGYVSDARASLHGTECMTWNEVRELDAAGIEFGSHTVTHPKLKTLGAQEIEQELRRSKETIEDNLGKPVTGFSYPFAFPETARRFVAQIRGMLMGCEYQAGVSTIIGTATAADDRFFLRRLPVNSSDDPRLFRAKLEKGYDWLCVPQRLKKTLQEMGAS